MTAHADCNHPATPAGRATCRRGRTLAATVGDTVTLSTGAVIAAHPNAVADRVADFVGMATSYGLTLRVTVNAYGRPVTEIYIYDTAAGVGGLQIFVGSGRRANTTTVSASRIYSPNRITKVAVGAISTYMNGLAATS